MINSIRVRLAVLFLGFSLPLPLWADATAPSPEAAKLQDQLDQEARAHAEMIRHLGEAEFRATDPGLDAAARVEAAQLAATTRSIERKTRMDGGQRATMYGQLSKLGASTQSPQEAKLEAAAYSLPKSLRDQLRLFAQFYDQDEVARKGAVPAHVYFGRELAAYAATLPAEGRRAKVAGFIAERAARLPTDDTLQAQNSLRDLWDSNFRALTEVFGDFVAGLEAAELLVELDGYTAESHAKYAEMLARNGHRDEALREIDVALALDEKNPRALQWAKQLADYAPELYTGVVEEPANPASLATIPVLAYMAPQPRDVVAIESAARTFSHRLHAALRAPLERRPEVVRQAMALQPALKGVLLEPTKSGLKAGFDAVQKAATAKNAVEGMKAFEAIPPETATHVLYWQTRSLTFILAGNYREAADGAIVVLAMDPENAWAKINGPKLEALARPKPPQPVVATEQRSPLAHSVDRAIHQGVYAPGDAAVAAALAQTPDNPDALVQRARLSAAKHDFASALADVEKAAAAGGPSAAEANGVEALIFLMQNKTTEAAPYMAKALQLSPDQPDALLAQAQTDMRQNQMNAAMEKLKRACAARPNFEDAFFLRASILINTGQGEEAVKILKTIIGRNPNAVGARAQLVIYYAQTGNFALARQGVTEISQLSHPMAAQITPQLTALVSQLEQVAPSAASAAPVAGEGKKKSR